MSRDFSSPRYKRWRVAVYMRDGFACRLCHSRDGINAHHIKQWARYPRLRFVVSNGITLCSVHHEQISGREQEFEERLGRLVGPGKKDIRVQMIMMRHDQE